MKEAENARNKNEMKKILLLVFLVSLLVSCSLDDSSSPDFTYKLAAVVSVEIPDTLIFQQVYDFDIEYKQPSTCNVFYGYDYRVKGNERFIGVKNTVYLDDNCEDLAEDNTAHHDLSFLVERGDHYIFKFWQGIDDEGEPVYLTKEVPVKLN